MQERTLLPRSCDRSGFEDASVDVTEAFEFFTVVFPSFSANSSSFDQNKKTQQNCCIEC